jgi:hypothetical protein
MVSPGHARHARNPDGHFDQPWWLVVCREGGSSDACVGYLFDLAGLHNEPGHRADIHTAQRQYRRPLINSDSRVRRVFARYDPLPRRISPVVRGSAVAALCVRRIAHAAVDDLASDDGVDEDGDGDDAAPRGRCRCQRDLQPEPRNQADAETDASNPTRVRPRPTRRDEDHRSPRRPSRANAPTRPLAARSRVARKARRYTVRVLRRRHPLFTWGSDSSRS